MNTIENGNLYIQYQILRGGEGERTLIKARKLLTLTRVITNFPNTDE